MKFMILNKFMNNYEMDKSYLIYEIEEIDE